MEAIIEEQLVLLALLVLKKLKLEKKLKKTLRCMLRKCFACLGMKGIEDQLKDINREIILLKTMSVSKKKVRSTTI